MLSDNEYNEISQTEGLYATESSCETKSFHKTEISHVTKPKLENEKILNEIVNKVLFKVLRKLLGKVFEKILSKSASGIKQLKQSQSAGNTLKN